MLSAVAAVFFLPLRIGVVPVPVSAVLSGALNLALVWVGWWWVRSPRLAAVSLWAWLATVIVLSTAGPGDDSMLGGVGVMNVMPLVLLVAGVGPAALLLWRRALAG
ncbi:hypothetical protein LV457_00620 [Mycobacterium sp. MYCO198283]|uniref:hypothetical protein n=1 Tax=Mycobacterium sp. MYCO198283 TaxID=2883505 RepID=UPI001E31CBA0|nr:hypothetical protein [Mycobacterium sp. MYCO198283]MCG5430802.1 hypothetical protein [Mycobacterium sp. MYCO198283]